jgi:hypothetical protein
MDQFLFRFREFWFLWLVFLLYSNGLWAAEPRVQILSPKDGSRITQEQNSVLISGKVATDLGRSPNIDIVFVIDISGSTSQYAGADFGDMGPLPDNSGSFGLGRPQISIGGMGGIVTPFWMPRLRLLVGCFSSLTRRPRGLAL